MQIKFPYSIDGRGRTAGAEDESHIRDMIEQVLFTAPGERVNRPTFGCNLMSLVFGPADGAMSAAAKVMVQSALQQWMGDLIAVHDVLVDVEESTVRVTIQYIIRRTQEEIVAEFSSQSGAIGSAVSVAVGQ